MAKSSRASSRKANNQRLKKKVFGPIESARAERLSAKLLELTARPKPDHSKGETEMEGVVGQEDGDPHEPEAGHRDLKDDDTMEVDSASKPTSVKKGSGKKRVEKRRAKRSSIVFPTYKDRKLRKNKQ